MTMIVYRANSLNNSVPLPIYLRATGWHTAHRGWTEKNDGEDRNYCGIFWCMNGSGNFTINDKTYSLEKGQVLYYLPYESHFIEIQSSLCTYYWVTFDGPLDDEFLKSFQYPRDPFYAKEYLVPLFEELFEILHDLTPTGFQRGSQALFRLLIAIGDRTTTSQYGSRDQELAKNFLQLASENFKNESFNVNTAADILKVHRTTLGRALKKQLNISPNNYIVNLRLQHALKMLYETDLKASEIGAACGIPDPCYFSKRIKQLTGKSPHKLRNNYG